jgi:creatinine amidohydrolase/Fe(II)-dependent formamide hydrolase-like protein
MCDIVESLAAQGFENILIYPGHGGSESLAQLKEALRILKWLNNSLEKVMIMILRRADYWSAPADKEMTGGDFHAGRSETSLMLAYRKELVRMEELELDEPSLADRMRLVCMILRSLRSGRRRTRGCIRRKRRRRILPVRRCRVPPRNAGLRAPE